MSAQCGWAAAVSVTLWGRGPPLCVQEVISKVQSLEADGALTGVMDDRGKVGGGARHRCAHVQEGVGCRALGGRLFAVLSPFA